MDGDVAAQTKAGLQHARTVGRRAKDRFCAIIEGARPSYAALTVEDQLRTPYDLRRKPDSGTFSDFYVSGSYIGSAALTAITALYAGAYIEPAADGIYVSCWEFLNPRGKRLTAGVDSKSIVVARAIAAAR